MRGRAGSVGEEEIVLASGSPRRHQLLTMLGLPHVVRPVDIEEQRGADESPSDYAQRLALEKARTGAGEHAGQIVLGADTIVVVENDILEKPRSAQEAVSMLTRLSGREHRVLSAVALVADGREFADMDVTTVWFREISAATIREYVATGEPMDKAGAYGIQGQGAVLVERIEGDYFGVMGLPLVRVMRLLDRAGRPFHFTR